MKTVLAAAAATSLSIVGAVLPAQPTIVQIRTQGYCLDVTTPAGEARVTVDVPEGAEPFGLNVLYGHMQSLGGPMTINETGEYHFQGALPVGETPFTVLINDQRVGEGVVFVDACETIPETPEVSTPRPIITPPAPVSDAEEVPPAPVAEVAPPVPTPATNKVPAGNTDGFWLQPMQLGK